MRDHTRENLTGLFRRFMDEPSARTVQQDLNAVERALEAQPAPAPSPETLALIKFRMVAAARRRHRRVQTIRAAMAAAAGVVVTVLVGRYGQAPTSRPAVGFASIIPTAVWESKDIAADDLDLAYFTSEIRQIEAQMKDLESGGIETRGQDALDDLEMELIAIETEYWKG